MVIAPAPTDEIFRSTSYARSGGRCGVTRWTCRNSCVDHSMSLNKQARLRRRSTEWRLVRGGGDVTTFSTCQ